MKKKVIIITVLAVLVLAAVTVAAILFRGKAVDGTRGVTGEYTYSVSENKDGSLDFCFEKNDRIEGTWRCDVEEDAADLSCTLKKGKTDKFHISPNEFGTSRISFRLNDGGRDVYCYIFTVTVDSDLKAYAIAVGAYGIGEAFCVKEGNISMDCSTEEGYAKIVVTCDAGDIWDYELPDGLNIITEEHSGTTRTFSAYGMKAGSYEVLIHNLTVGYTLSVSLKVEDSLACIAESGKIVGKQS